MRNETVRFHVILALLAGVVFLASCHKQVATAPTAPTPTAQPARPATTAAVRATPAPVARNVSAAAPSTPAPTPEQLFHQNVKDAFFDYDKADIRPDARDVLSHDADFLKAYSQIHLMIEGHCDERGGEEYNLALGERRAEATKQYLVSLGVSADRVQVVSYGKERPFCTAEGESCYQQNRRGHLDMPQ